MFFFSIRFLAEHRIGETLRENFSEEEKASFKVLRRRWGAVEKMFSFRCFGVYATWRRVWRVVPKFWRQTMNGVKRSADFFPVYVRTTYRRSRFSCIIIRCTYNITITNAYVYGSSCYNLFEYSPLSSIHAQIINFTPICAIVRFVCSRNRLIIIINEYTYILYSLNAHTMRNK